MKQDRKQARRAQIEEAAYALISEKGFAGASMLNIAKRARASNETLYNWYGDKLGLFTAMVDSNARRVSDVLQQAHDQQGDPVETLNAIGPVLLDMLTGDRAVALNRAAAADPSGQLGQALAKAGRNSVAPLIAQTLEHARVDGLLHFDDPARAADLYLGLLIGDLQLRCVTGQIPAPDAETCKARARQAATHLRKLLG